MQIGNLLRHVPQVKFCNGRRLIPDCSFENLLRGALSKKAQDEDSTLTSCALILKKEMSLRGEFPVGKLNCESYPSRDCGLRDVMIAFNW